MKCDNKHTIKKITKSLFDIDSSSSEEWVESGDSLDDVEIGLEEAEEVEVSQIKDHKLGDYIVAKFLSTGKKSLRNTVYKYVAVILQKMSDCDFQIQCLKSVNKQKNSVCGYRR